MADTAQESTMQTTDTVDADLNGLRYGEPPDWWLGDVEGWDRLLRQWACDCVERVVHHAEEWLSTHAPEHAGAPTRAIEVTRRYALGEASEEERRTARDAADAAWDAADAAWDATGAAWAAAGAAWNATGDATWAARNATRAAAWAAAWNAARTAEREWQTALRVRVDEARGGWRE